MKIISFLLSAFVLMMTFSCKFSEKENIDDLVRLNEELKVTPAKNESRGSDAPGVMPSDHKLMLMMHEPEKYGWKEFYDYLKNDLDEDSDKHYYNNLQWLNIRNIVKARNFDDAPKEINMELWQLILSRNHINEPDVAYKLINRHNINGNELQVAKMAYHVIKTNKKFYEGNPEGWRKSYEANYDTYQKLRVLTFDRWGLPLVNNAGI